MAPTVTVHEDRDYTRFTVKNDRDGWLEGWIYPDGRPQVFAHNCTPIRMLPGTHAGIAILRAMAAYGREEN